MSANKSTLLTFTFPTDQNALYFLFFDFFIEQYVYFPGLQA